MFEELSIAFENPATDPMGFETVSGKLTCLRDQVRLQFKEKDRAFRKNETRVVEFAYREIEDLSIESKWFRPARVTLETRALDKLDGFPGSDVGRVEMSIEKRDVAEAKKMAGVIELRKSEEILADSESRLRRTPDE